MARRRNKRTGEVQELQNGQWVTVSQGSPGIVLSPGNPLAQRKSELEVRGAEQDVAAGNREAALAGVKAEQERAAAEKARADAELARLKLDQERDARQGKTLKDEENLIRGNLNSVGDQILTLEGLHRQNLEGGFPNFIAGRMPTDTNAQFKTAGSQLLDVGQAAFRVPGSGDQSAQELTFKLDAYLPKPTDTDKEIRQKLDYMKSRVDNQRQALGMEPMDWNVGPDLTLPPTATSQGQGMTVSRGGTRSVEDPILKGLAGRVGKMMVDGAPDAEIVSFLQKAGVNPADTSVGQALQFRRTRDFKRWKQANPGTAYPVGESFYTKEVPLTAGEGAFNSAAQSPLGAYAMSAGSAVTGNRLDGVVGAMGGNAERARVGMDVVRAENPVASFAGDMTGAALDQYLLARVPGLRANRFAAPANDAVYGAFAGTGDGGAGGGALGATSNIAGGMFGRGAARATGAGLRGAQDAGLRYLNNSRVPLTIGQMARSGNGPVSRAVSTLEDRLSGFQFVGDVVNTARRRGVEGFNEAGFREGLGPINGALPPGTVGVDALEGMQQQTGQAYRNALAGVRLNRDPAFDVDFNTATVRGAANPRHGQDFQHIIDTEIQPLFGPAGELTGENLQAAIQILRRHRAGYRGQPLGNNMQDALSEVETALTGMVGRQAPDVMPQLGRANQTFANRAVLRGAVQKGKNTDELFTPAQLNDASVTNTTRFGGPDAANSANRPFYDLGRHGQAILPSKVPDSGTAGRAALAVGGAAALGGTGGLGADYLSGDDPVGNGAGLGVLPLLLAAPYTRVGQRALQGMVMGARPRQVNVLGDLLATDPRFYRPAGMFGSAAARNYYTLDEQPIN